jgi:hypothetical protein
MCKVQCAQMQPSKPNRIVMAALFLPFAAFAQQPANNDPAANGATLQALLTEVRQLRVALERSTTVLPRLQLAIARYQMQQERVDRLDRELRTFRAQLASDSSSKDRMTASIKQFEDQASQTPDPAARSHIEEAAKAMKAELEQQTLREQSERTQEIEMSSLLKTEQGKLNDLSEQLNQLDRKMQQQ